MMKTLGAQRRHLQIPLHGVHLGHAVGDWRARREHNSASTIDSLDVANFEEHIEGSLGRGLRQAGDASHFSDVEEVLEVLRLIDDHEINAEFLKRERVVLLLVSYSQL